MDRIKIAVIGCGGMSRWHADQINSIPELVVDSLTDIVRSHAEKLLAEKFSALKPAPTVFIDHRKMLEKTNPDAVLIITPHTTHFPICVDSLNAGKHVLVEKPMVTSSHHAVELHNLVNRTGKLLEIGFQAPYTREFQYARKVISSGELGPLQLATGIMSQGWMRGTAGSWRQDPKISGGGQLYDSCAHVLNGMMWLVDSPVTEVFCFLDRKGTAVDINAVVNIRFANGCMGNITSGGNCKAWHSELYIQGENGFLNLTLYGGKIVHVQDNQDVKYPMVPWPYESPHRNFVNVLLGKDTPRCPVRYGVLLADLMDAVYASAASGVPVKVQSTLNPEAQAETLEEGFSAETEAAAPKSASKKASKPAKPAGKKPAKKR